MLPPDEKTALQVMKRVQNLSAEEISKRLRNEVGDPLLAMFQLLAKSIVPNGDEREVSKVVHLMVLAYIFRGELPRQSSKPPLRPVPKKRS